jgi:hypothetical protein
MLTGKPVSEFDQLPERILRRIRTPDPMMQVNFNFSPARMAVLGESTHKKPVVLFGWIKIRVNEWLPFGVTKLAEPARILPAPVLEPSLLFVERSTLRPATEHNRRFEVIGHAENQVHSIRNSPDKPLPHVPRRPSTHV